jgi:hypothetical protein
MSKAKHMLLSLVAVLSLGAMLASSASAAIKFEYRVNGAKLEAGSTKEFTTSAHSVIDLNGTAGGAGALLLSSKIKTLAGSKIIGGIPGTNEEQVVFESVKVDKPANCEVIQLPNGAAGVVQTVPLKSEIVEGASAGLGNGEVDILFTPAAGTTFATFEFIGASCTLKGSVPAVTGSVLALSLPQGTEALTGILDYPAVTSEYKNQAGAFKKVFLTFAGNAATLTGAALVALVSDEKFGAF